MVTRIATYATTSTVFSQSQRVQMRYANAATQASSGLRSENFKGISDEAQRLLVLQSENDGLAAQASAIESATIRLGALQNTTATISEILSQVATLFLNVQNGIDIVGNAAANVGEATVLRDSIVSLLNSQIGSAYLFSGSAYNVRPVDITDALYTPNAAPGTPDFDYYQGDDVIDSLRASDSLRIDYGITANNPAFEKALRGLQIYINNPTNTVLIAQANDLNRQAIDEVASINGQLLARSNLMESSKALNESVSFYLEENISLLRDSDVAAATTQMSQFETQLKASFGALSKLLQLRLTDFLR